MADRTAAGVSFAGPEWPVSYRAFYLRYTEAPEGSESNEWRVS